MTRTGRRSTGSTSSGRRAEDWADDHETLQHVLRWVEIGFNTIPVMVATLVIVVLLLVRGHRRAAVVRRAGDGLDVRA